MYGYRDTWIGMYMVYLATQLKVNVFTACYADTACVQYM